MLLEKRVEENRAKKKKKSINSGAVAYDGRPPPHPPSEKMKFRRKLHVSKPRRRTWNRERRETFVRRERKIFGNERKMGSQPIYTPCSGSVLLTRHRVEPNRPKTISSRPNADLLLLPHFIFCTPPGYYCTPPCCNFYSFCAFFGFASLASHFSRAFSSS